MRKIYLGCFAYKNVKNNIKKDKAMAQIQKSLGESALIVEFKAFI